MGNDGRMPLTLNALPLRIAPQRIGFLRFILEAYDGMALVTTINAKEGRIVIRYAPSFHNDLLAILHEAEGTIGATID